jgi:predicted dehydrogenase
MGTESGHSRRQFIKSSAVAAAGTAALAEHGFAILGHAAPDAPIRVGLIGCGGRGVGALLNVLQVRTDVVYPARGYHTENVADGARVRAEGVKVAALSDLFEDRLTECRAQLKKVDIEVPDDACFTGFDAYEKLLAREDVNYVILACPPHFRPQHLEAAVEAGKHVFMEKPIAVDATGVRTVLEAGRTAARKGLGVVAGTQRRHDGRFVDTIQRLRDGAVGPIHTCRAYWNGGLVWVVEREEGWSDLEWQLRNWVYNTWVSGDHIVEQHLHSLDVANWVLGAHPVSARGMGGRQVHGSALYGNAYDHFAVEYEYPDGARMFSQCRQMNDCDNRVATLVEGSEGHADCQGQIWDADGQSVWEFDNPNAPNPYEQEHADLIRSIREGRPLNEAEAVAYSTLTGIMGRESAYSGKVVTWEEALSSKQDLRLEEYDFAKPLPLAPVPMPGTYELV